MTDPVEQADADWNGQCAWYLVNGLSGADQPRLTDASPFYSKGLSERPNDEFTDAYNSRITELLKEYGVPNWAPEKRVPDRGTAVDLIVDYGRRIDDYVAQSKAERTFFRLSRFWWNENGPHVWHRDEVGGFLFLAGEENPACGSIVVFDTQECVLASRFEYLRKHTPSFPFLSEEPVR